MVVENWAATCEADNYVTPSYNYCSKKKHMQNQIL